MRKPQPAFAKIRSDLAGIAFPPMSNGQAAVLAAMARQLDDSQWLPQQTIAQMQFRQLGPLADHCRRYSPQFRRRLEKAGLEPEDLLSAEGLRRLPVLTRRDVQAAGDLFCTEVPAGHAPLNQTRTSGSTGETVVVHRTSVSNFDWLALTLREHLWHGRDFSKPLCAVRAHINSAARKPDWAPPASLLFDTGPSLGIPLGIDIDRQLDMIAQFAPDSLLIYPSNLAGLARASMARGIALPSLRHLRTIGETVSPQLRAEMEAVFPAKIEDVYSSQEIGYIACQCPDAPLYHVMETVMVEILDDRGAPCAPGEIGRVIVTDLRNCATPLIRYDMGDYAEVGPACPCGRGLPTLTRILGRERNLIRMPDGTSRWPMFGGIYLRDIAPIRQYQAIQQEQDRLEIRLVCDTPLTAEQEQGIRALVLKTLGQPFRIDLVYFEREIPKGANGKFEEFICRVT